jgi:spore maturation protein CgeB
MSQRDQSTLSVAIVGNAGGTNIGDSLRRAAISHGHQLLFFDAYRASCGNRLLRALSWRLFDRKPLRLKQFSEDVVNACSTTARPDFLIATGGAPLVDSALRALRAKGIVCINYSTDDPWSPTQRAQWYLRALPAYDVVFTPRIANIGDLLALGCSDVRYLPFGYDEDLWATPQQAISAPVYDVLFVGGADPERVAFMTAFMHEGPPVALVGAYWERNSATRPYALGHKPPETLRALTVAAKVNLCLVRRANRDGHVMRSFEIAAMGGCMLVEDTAEHRAILGEDGEAVLYFRSPDEAATRVHTVLADPLLRAHLGAQAQRRITWKPNRYADRLETMLRCRAN